MIPLVRPSVVGRIRGALLSLACAALLSPSISRAELGSFFGIPLAAKVTAAPYLSTSGFGGKLEVEAFDRRGGFGVSLGIGYSVGSSVDLSPLTHGVTFRPPGGGIGVETTTATGDVSSAQAKLMLLATYNHAVTLRPRLALRLTGGLGLGAVSEMSTVRQRFHVVTEYMDGITPTTYADYSGSTSLRATAFAGGAQAKIELEFHDRFVVGAIVDAALAFGSPRLSNAGAVPPEAVDDTPPFSSAGTGLVVGWMF